MMDKRDLQNEQLCVTLYPLLVPTPKWLAPAVFSSIYLPSSPDAEFG